MLTNFYFCDKLLSVNKFAGVTQWQSSSFPSWLRGFDSLHPLHFGRVYPCFYLGFGNPLFEIFNLLTSRGKIYKNCNFSFGREYEKKQASMPSVSLTSETRPKRSFFSGLRFFAHWARLALFPSPAPVLFGPLGLLF